MERKVVKLHDLILIVFSYFFLYSYLGNTLAGIVLKSEYTKENLIFVQLLVDILIMLVILFLSIRVIIHSLKQKFGIDFFVQVFKNYIWILLANFIIAIPITLIVGDATSNNQEILELFTKEYKSYMFFMTIIFAPIVEELVFRGAIYKYSRQLFNRNLATIITSLSFAGMHFLMSIIAGDLSDLIFLPLYLIPSIFLCAIYEKTRNIFAPILLHLINNYMSFMLTVQ